MRATATRAQPQAAPVDMRGVSGRADGGRPGPPAQPTRRGIQEATIVDLQEIMAKIKAVFEADTDVVSVGAIDGEANVLGVELVSGEEFFLTVDVV